MEPLIVMKKALNTNTFLLALLLIDSSLSKQWARLHALFFGRHMKTIEGVNTYGNACMLVLVVWSKKMWHRNTSIASSIHLCVYYLYRVLSPFFKAKLLRKSKPLPEKAGLNFSLSDSMHVMRTIHKCILHTRYWCISIPHAGSNAQPLAFLHIPQLPRACIDREKNSQQFWK